MTLDEVVNLSGNPNGDVTCFDAGEDLDKAGLLVTIGADLRLYLYTSSDVNHCAAFVVNAPKEGQPAQLRLSGFVDAVCKDGCNIQDRLMPSLDDDGKVELWQPGYVTVGFSMALAADGDPVRILIHHEIAST